MVKRIGQHGESRRLLVLMPSWLGDTVMATPTIRALRHLYPAADMTALVRATVRPILDACPWIDRFFTVRPRRKGAADGPHMGALGLARRLMAGRDGS